MGLFSSKKEYSAYAASSGLFDDPPETFKNNVVQTMIGGGSPSDAVIDTIFTDYHARAKKMTKFASRSIDDPRPKYIRGLPTSNMSLITVDPTVIEAALTRAVGPYNDIYHTYKGKWNERFFLTKHLQEYYTNATYFPWGLPPTSDHWDADMESVQIPVVDSVTGLYYTSNNAYEFIRGNNLNPYDDNILEEIGPDAYARLTMDEDDNYQVSFPYVDNAGVDQLWDVASKIDVGDVFEHNWIMVEYLVGTEVRYWAYKINSGVDPILESALDVNEMEASFLPVGVLMQDKVWFDTDPESELAISTNKLLKKLGTDGTEIREQFQAQEEEDNASGDAEKTNAEKWDFFIHFAIPLRTVDRGSLEYMYHFFSDMQEWSTTDSTDYYKYLATPASSQPVSELNITEAGENGYNVSYRWSYIEKQERSG